MKSLSFASMFKALTGNGPFPWQGRLYDLLLAGQAPKSCDIPTGLGKTSIIPIWLLALANSPKKVPRRLIYVVNRRTVVDQATTESENLRRRIAELPELRSRLRELCGIPTEEPLAISTLRGQFADNREWSADPARPAIILGTVDMIGSRLLFGGYGIGYKTRPLHAGFLGQDALLVHDEAHLEPAFQELLQEIEDQQAESKDFREFRVMELTATPRNGESAFRIDDEDRAHPEIRKRLEATKRLRLHPAPDRKKLVEMLTENALAHKDSGRAVLVFARSVEDVEKTADNLRKAGREVDTLTGTLRGKERDQLVRKDTGAFRRFLREGPQEGPTVYLVCTSAGEVGINISADDLVCDLSTFESMAQRFGRVNRFGRRDNSQIDVIHPVEFDEKTQNLRATLDILSSLDSDGSPAALSAIDPVRRNAAFSLPPRMLTVTDILLDAWSLTSIREPMPGRPPLHPFLHGEEDPEPPQTQLAWRSEVDIIDEELVATNPPETLLEEYPLKPHELLKDRTDRIHDRLGKLAAKHGDMPAWLVDESGTVDRTTINKLAEKDSRDALRGRVVLLGPKAGGLSDGLFTGDSNAKADDVADDWLDEQGERRRQRTWDDDIPRDMRRLREIDTRPGADDQQDVGDKQEAGDEAADHIEPTSPSTDRFWCWYVRPRSADDEGSGTSREPVKWETHCEDVKTAIAQIAAALDLRKELQEALAIAGKLHDSGKRRVRWQRSIGNPDPKTPLAKSGVRMKPLDNLTNYRHELGSLVDAGKDAEFQGLDEDMKDLVLHVIAAHHGLGRPYFPEALSFDPENDHDVVVEATAEVPQRFARLQRRYGRWGLAYLESILRAADYSASANPSKTEKGPA